MHQGKKHKPRNVEMVPALKLLSTSSSRNDQVHRTNTLQAGVPTLDQLEYLLVIRSMKVFRLIPDSVSFVTAWRGTSVMSKVGLRFVLPRTAEVPKTVPTPRRADLRPGLQDAKINPFLHLFSASSATPPPTGSSLEPLMGFDRPEFKVDENGIKMKNTH